MNTLLRTVTTSVLYGLFLNAAYANFSGGSAALKKGDFTEAMTQFQACLPSPGCQYAVGLLYYNGQGVTKDYKEAFRMFTLSAAQGDAEAQYNLGVMYEAGQGVPKDDKEAVRMFSLAAAQGDVFAQNNLGVMYRDGKGVPQDYKEALRLFRLAADRGNASAQVNLAALYGNGSLALQNQVLGYALSNLAAANGDTQYATRNRDLIATRLSQAEIAIAQELTREMYQSGKVTPIMDRYLKTRK